MCVTCLTSFVCASSRMTHDSAKTRASAALLIVNARVQTGDPRRPWADAVLIVGDRIEAVGASAELRKRRTLDAAVIDAKGRTLRPSPADARLARGEPASLVLLARSVDDPAADRPDGSGRDDDVVFEVVGGRIVLDRDSLAG